MLKKGENHLKKWCEGNKMNCLKNCYICVENIRKIEIFFQNPWKEQLPLLSWSQIRLIFFQSEVVFKKNHQNVQ